MRTLEVPDEFFALAEAEAKRRGVSVEDLVVSTASPVLSHPATQFGNRVEFPVFTSKNPGTLHLTNADIRRMEEEDDLRMPGRLD